MRRLEMKDPDFCDHEWWEDNWAHKFAPVQRCRLCGKWRDMQPTERELEKSGWIKIEEIDNIK